MTPDLAHSEQNILRVMRKVLAGVVKDVTPQEGQENPLSARTIEEIRDLFGLISLREQALSEQADAAPALRPHYPGQDAGVKAVPINVAGLSAGRKNASTHPLAETVLFRGVDMAAIEEILDACPIHDLKAGESLLATGSVTNDLFLVMGGVLRVSLGERVARFGPGETLGEISALGESTMAAAVVAEEEALVLAIGHHSLWAMIDRDAVLARNVLTLLAQG